MESYTMRREDLLEGGHLWEYADSLWSFMEVVKQVGASYTNWHGTFDDRSEDTVKNRGPMYAEPPGAFDDISTPWFAIWEYAWALKVTALEEKEDQLILDIGGALSPLALYLMGIGHRVVVVDPNPDIGREAERARVRLGARGTIIHRPLKAQDWIVKSQPDPEFHFDHVLAISSLHIIGLVDRLMILSSITDVTKPGCIFATTFDYLNPNPARCIKNPCVELCPSGFTAARPWVDRQERPLLFHPDPLKGNYTMGGIKATK